MKGPGGANAGSGARRAEMTGGAPRRITLALRNAKLGTGVTSLRALVARAQAPDTWASSSRLGRTNLVNAVAAGEPALALTRQALQACPTCDDNAYNFIYAIGGEGVAQLGTWLQFHQAPRAASAAVCAGIVVDEFGEEATKEIVAALIACRADQVLPAIEDYLYKQKGMDRGDVD